MTHLIEFGKNWTLLGPVSQPRAWASPRPTRG